MSSENLISRERKDAVAILRIDRAEKKNALTAAMYGALAAGLADASKDEGVRVILLLGRPGAFSAGNDLNDFVAAALGGQRTTEVMDFLRAIATSTKPLVAGVDGVAVGVGVTMLLHCDQVVASDRSQFHAPFVDLGLVPEAGSSLIAPRLMGHHRAFALLAMGQVFSAADAREAGFVNLVTKPEALESTALTLAEAIAAKPPEALGIARRLLRGDQSDILERISEEGRLFGERLKSPEALAAFQAFFNRK